MSNTMIGANVEELDTLANSMSQSAEKLISMCSALRALPRGVWKGTDAAQFFQELDSSLIPQTNAVATALSTASSTLSANAAAQRETSNTLDGGAGSNSVGPGSAPLGGAGQGTGWDPGSTAIDGFLKLAGFGASLLGESKDLEFLKIGAVGELGLTGLDAIEALGSMARGDLNEAAFNVLKTASNALKLSPGAGLAASFGFDVFEGAIPLTGVRQNELFDFTAQRLYGGSMEQITPEQRMAMGSRYEGGLGGYGAMIHDSVLESAANADNILWTGINLAGEGLATGIYGLMTGKW